MINDENVFDCNTRKLFRTPIKAGMTMTWNSPYHTIEKNTPKLSENINDQRAKSKQLFTTTTTSSSSAVEGVLFDINDRLEDQQQYDAPPCFNTDIPVLDDLFSELNSDLPYSFNNITTDLISNNNYNNIDSNFNVNNLSKFQSEPIDFYEIERLLLQPTTATNTASNSQSQSSSSRRSHAKQSFSSRLASIPSSSSTNILDPSLFDENNPFYDPNPNPMLWDDNSGSSFSRSTLQEPLQALPPSNLILLQDAAANNTQSGKIKLKVIGVDTTNDTKKKPKLDSCGSTTSTHVIKKPYVMNSQHSTKKEPNQTYKSYGKKRQVIGKDYADFVSRLQNDIPFDSSEDEEDEEYKIKEFDEQKHRNNQLTVNNKSGQYRISGYSVPSESNDDYSSSSSSSDEEECKPNTKISSQELLELFEDQCSGLPGIISAYLTHRKHQIVLKGYKPRANANTIDISNLNLSTETISTTNNSNNTITGYHGTSVPLLSQNQFTTLKSQIARHFQFLIQNLALSNELENCEGTTLINLKLLVQLHLHLDSTCKLLINFNSTMGNNKSGSSQIGPVNNNQNLNLSRISCLNSVPSTKINPIRSALVELIPSGIGKVSIIAGFLARPGQKQFLSLCALRNDPTIKPKSSPLPPTSARIKAHLQLNHQQLLSNSFYNIIALFHDYIDASVLESTVNAVNLSKYLELPPSEPTLLLLPDYSYSATNNSNNNINTGNIVGKTAKFSPGEDNLLLCGLRRFGCGNWESIQAQFLPSRTARQLAIRYKNLSSRREPMNPVKEFNERLMMPLNEIEEDLLYKGVQRFGNQFHLISKHYLPHRPATVLGKLWKAMDEARRNS